MSSDFLTSQTQSLFLCVLTLVSLRVCEGPFNFDSPKDFSVDAMVEAITKKRAADDEEEKGNEENVENHVPVKSSRKKRRS